MKDIVLVQKSHHQLEQASLNTTEMIQQHYGVPYQQSNISASGPQATMLQWGMDPGCGCGYTCWDKQCGSNASEVGKNEG